MLITIVMIYKLIYVNHQLKKSSILMFVSNNEILTVLFLIVNEDIFEIESVINSVFLKKNSPSSQSIILFTY